MFQYRVFLRLTRAWLLGIIRDRATVFWMLLFPVLFVVIFGLAFGGEGVGSFQVGVVVERSTPAGGALLAGLGSVEIFEVSTGPEADELAKLRNGERDVVLVQQPAAGSEPGAALLLYHDPAQAATGQIVLPIVRQVVAGVDQRLSGRAPLLSVEERSVRAADLRFIDYFLPGIVAFSIMQSGMFAAIPLVQLRITRVLKRFGATPLPRWLVLASQGATRVVLALVTTVVLILTGRLLFGVETGSNWLGQVSLVLLGSAVFLSLGFVISGLAKTEEAVPALVQAVSFPMMFLAGVFWPVENFPPFMQVIARALPLTFLWDGLRQVMVGGAALHPLWVDYAVLLVWLVGGGLLAVRFFKWE